MVEVAFGLCYWKNNAFLSQFYSDNGLMAVWRLFIEREQSGDVSFVSQEFFTH